MTRPSSSITRMPVAALAPLTIDSLQPHSDLTFRTLDNLTIEGANLRQSLLNGCLIRNCTFRQVDLSRCDLEQVQFLQCRFESVDFENVELTSTMLVGCQFEHCRFDSALLNECTWRNCSIIECSFTQSVVHQSQFEGCTLRANNLQGASIQLDTFRSCAFEEMTLGDCTFLNQLLLDCRYRDVRLNAESIGSVFGLSEKDLLSLDLIYLGNRVVDVRADGPLLEALEKDYEQRRWFFMREMLRLSFGRGSRVIALERCLDAVLWPASLGAPLKSSDITFLEMVILELFRRKELPGAATVGLPERIKTFQRGSAAQIEGNESPKLQQLAARLRSLMLEMLRNLQTELETLSHERKDRAVVARLVFEKRPVCDVVEFVRTSAAQSGLKVGGTTVALREEQGSYILVLQTTLLTLAGLQMALWLLNGCVAQVIELRTRAQIALQKRAPIVIRQRVLLPDQHVPKWMARGIQTLFAKLTANAATLDRTADDLDARNLRAIEIAEPAKPRKRSRAKRRAS